MNRNTRGIIAITVILAIAVIVLIPLGVRLLGDRPESGAGTPTPLGITEATPATDLPVETDVVAAVETPDSAAAPAGTQRLVYGETDPDGSLTTILMLDPASPENPTAVAQIEHQPGYPPTGAVSPDGTRLALQRVPPGASEQAARTNGGEIWVVNLDGSGQQQVASQAGFVVDWVPDSQSLVYGARILPDNAQDTQAPARTQLTQVNADGSSPQMLVDDAQAFALQPLGWSSGGERFYSAAYTPAGWALNYWDHAQQAQVNGEPIAQDGQVRSFSLSPDGQRLLLDVLAADGEELVLYNLADGARQTVSQMPSTAPAGSHLSALWSADGQRLLIGNPSEAPAQQMRVFVPDGADFAPSPFQPPSTPQSNALTPLRWSPDSAWIVLRDYTAAGLPVYLQHTGDAALTPLPQQKAGSSLTVYGWVTP